MGNGKGLYILPTTDTLSNGIYNFITSSFPFNTEWYTKNGTCFFFFHVPSSIWHRFSNFTICYDIHKIRLFFHLSADTASSRSAYCVLWLAVMPFLMSLSICKEIGEALLISHIAHCRFLTMMGTIMVSTLSRHC